jgi:uncharacterized protein YneF (UPF0154 family)
MATFLLVLLMVFTIGAAFVVGIALGYWVICGILNLFNRQHPTAKPTTVRVLATTPGGD